MGSHVHIRIHECPEYQDQEKKGSEPLPRVCSIWLNVSLALIVSKTAVIPRILCVQETKYKSATAMQECLTVHSSSFFTTWAWNVVCFEKFGQMGNIKEKKKKERACWVHCSAAVLKCQHWLWKGCMARCVRTDVTAEEYGQSSDRMCLWLCCFGCSDRVQNMKEVWCLTEL